MAGHLDACVVGLGARTSVGLTATESAASVRADINLFALHPFMVDKTGRGMVVSRAPYLSEELGGIDRLAELAVPAAQEALATLGTPARALPSFPLVIGLPGPRPGRTSDLVEGLANRLSGSLAATCQLELAQVFECGHAAGLMAIEAGCRLIEAGETDFCLAGGVDSYIEPETLEWLDSEEQLHSRATRYGFTPGEAAGLCLLASPSAAESGGLGLYGLVLAAATAMESNLIKTDTVCIGEGLTEAFKQVLQPFAHLGHKVDQVICDLNGERYRANEYGFSISRTAERFVDPTRFIAPADCWGDVGAASGPLFVALAAIAGLNGYAPGPHALIWASSESGERSAMLLRVASEET